MTTYRVGRRARWLQLVTLRKRVNDTQHRHDLRGLTVRSHEVCSAHFYVTITTRPPEATQNPIPSQATNSQGLPALP